METTPLKHGRRYPWKKWFGKKRITLWKGEDFNGRTVTFALQVRRAARVYGKIVKIITADDENCITVEVTNG